MPLAAGPKKGQWGLEDEENSIAASILSDTCTHTDNERYFYSLITLIFEEARQGNGDCSSGYCNRLVNMFAA